MKIAQLKARNIFSLLLTTVFLLLFVNLSQAEKKDEERKENTSIKFDFNEKQNLQFLEDSQVSGFLEIALELSYSRDKIVEKKTFQRNIVSSTKTSLQVCLASNDNEKEWTLNSCLEAIGLTQKIFPHNKGDQFTMLQRFGIVQFKISRKMKSTHLLIRKMPSDPNQYEQFYWTTLPFQSLGDGVLNHLTLTASENTDKSFVAAYVTLSCALNQYGPGCAVTCLPGSEQQRCDHETGQLKCAPGWVGRNCEHQVFISNKVASQFIKHRSKRGNSWLRTEEFQGGNIERECEEEKCSREEAREAFEDNALTATYWRAYTDKNQCQPNPCIAANSIRCEDLIGNYACHCRPGYRGKNCHYEIDICQSGPCHNGGICQRHGLTSFACICPAGFRGPTCNLNIDECLESNCGLYGTCVDGINSFTCNCDAGFTGSACDININECEGSPCQNGGNCTDHVAFYTCQCPAEYDGQNCESRISPCISGPCMNDGKCVSNEDDYTYTCTCTPQFTGKRCQHAVDSVCGSEPCSNGGTCFVDRNVLTLPEDSNQNSNSSQEFNCLCPIGYEGDTCEEIISPCELGPDDLCPFNSTCVGLSRQYICVCPDGFTGDSCQIPGNHSEVLDRLLCQNNPCLNEGRCVHLDNDTVCVCRPGFNGTRCEHEVDFCESSPCINNGECIPAPNGFYCNCAKGRNGRYCEKDVDECSRAEDLCQNGGTCSNTDGSFQCICGPYSTGRYCETPFDPCDVVPCGNGGTCSHADGPAGYMCDCVAGYGGNDCNDIIDPCTDVTDPCHNNARCVANPDLATEAICMCPDGFYGRTCAKEKDNCAISSNSTLNINGEMLPQLVERSDCGENGDCVSTDEGFICYCHRGYDGDRCQRAYSAPMVNCSSEFCLCPAYLIDEVLYHDANSTLKCQYRHYDQGACKKVTCISSTCPNQYDEHYCNWRSQCLEKFFAEASESTQSNSTSLCPVIEVVLDRTKLPRGATTQEFCRKVRDLPSYQRRSDSATIHCNTLQLNEANSTVAIAIDSVSSQDQAVLLAFNIFQRLAQELVNASNSKPNDLADGLDPIFSAILSLKFGDTRGRVQNTNDDHIKPTVPLTNERQQQLGLGYNLLFIIIPVALLLLIIVIIVFFVWRRKRQRKELQVMYVANPDTRSHSEGNDSDQAMMTASRSGHGTPVKKTKLEDDFVNPLFVQEPTYSALASRPAAESNPYVATPYATSLSFSACSSSGQNSKKSVEEATIDYGVEQKPLGPLNDQYEDMHGHTLSFNPNRPSTSTGETVYTFAQDFMIPGQGKKSHRTRSSRPKQNKKDRLSCAYEEIDINRLPTPNDNPYETVGFVSPLGASKPEGKIFEPESSKQRGIPNEEQYNFATEVPKVGVPSPFLSRRSTQQEESGNKENKRSSSRSGSDTPSFAASGDDSGIEVVVTNISSSPVKESREAESKNEEEYQTPTTHFPQKDDLFFPNRNVELPEVYAVPRRANPADKSS